MSWASAVGSVFSSAVSAFNARKMQDIAWQHQKEYSQNAHQWEVEDLKKAGLNPILSAGGSGAGSTSVAAPTASIENPLANFTSTKIQKKLAQAEIDNKLSNTSANNANAKEREATANSIIQQTGMEKELFEYKKQEAAWNVKTAEQNYLNATKMPAVYDAQIRNYHSSSSLQDSQNNRARAEQPFWQGAGELIASGMDAVRDFDYREAWSKAQKAWDDLWKDDSIPDEKKKEYLERSGFIKWLDDGGTVASYAKHKDKR